MAYDLSITFIGLCLFVSKDGKMHVLMPDTSEKVHNASEHGADGHAHGATNPKGKPPFEEHMAVMLVDTAYLFQGSTELDDTYLLVSLRGRDFEFPKGSDTLNSILPEEVLKLDNEVPRQLIEAAMPITGLAARQTLLSGGVVDHDPGACWTWEGEPRPMSHRLTWTIKDIEGDYYPLSLSASTQRPLYPMEAGEDKRRMIQVAVFYGEPSELPVETRLPEPPDTGTPAHHFVAINAILKGKPTKMPEYHKEKCDGVAQVQRKGKSGRGGSPFTCMLSTAPPEGGDDGGGGV
jgi:hypothetical protein